MNSDMAREILQQMLDGVDPTTGEILPKDHFCHDPTVIRALHRAVVALAGQTWVACAPEADAEAALPAVEPQWLRRNGRLRADRPWTVEDIAALQQLYQQGMPVEEIARRLQRRLRGTENELRRLGLMAPKEREKKRPDDPPRHGMAWTRDDDLRLQEMYEQQWDVQEMAAELQRTPRAIMLRLEAQGYAVGMLDVLEEEQPKNGASAGGNSSNGELYQLYENGASVKELAAHFGCTERMISARLFYLGLTREAPISLRGPEEKQK